MEEHVLNLLINNFQVKQSDFENIPTFKMWSSFLAVLLLGSLFSCTFFAELYDGEQEYGNTDNLMKKGRIYGHETGFIRCGKSR